MPANTRYLQELENPQVEYNATGAPSLSNLASSAVGEAPFLGAVAVTLSQLAATASGAQLITSTVVVTLSQLTAVGFDQYSASAVITLSKIGSTGNAYSLIKPEAAIILVGLVANGTGVMLPVGSATATLPNLVALVNGATDQSVRIHVPLQKRFGVFIHNGWYPHERIAELITAHNINRADARMEVTNGVVEISMNDPRVNTDNIQPGQILVIESPLYDTWAGPIVTITEDNRNSTIQLHALSWLSILDGRIAPQDEYWKPSIASGIAVRSLITIANMRSHTGIYLPTNLETGPSVVDWQSGGQSLLEAFNELHNRTNYEYWIDLDVTPSHIIATMQWGQRQGRDTNLHLYSGVHFIEGTYTQDVSKAVQMAVSMGDFGVELGKRNSVATVANQGPQRIDIGASHLHDASVLAVRAISDLPIGMRTERMEFEIMTHSLDELTRRSQKSLERPLPGKESMGDIANSLVDWHDLAVGNTYYRHDFALGRQFERLVRVVNIQPDDERVEAQLETELVLA